jgi:hypothetical protein
MASFAVLEGQNVINIIEANSKSDAEIVTGKTCVETTDKPAQIGGTYVNGKFIKIKPFPSWIKDGDSDWKAPIEAPTPDPEDLKVVVWNETTLTWDVLDLPELPPNRRV